MRSYIRGALEVGISPEDIREIFFHTAFYCGLPTAVGAIRIAKEVFSEPRIASHRGKPS